MKIELFARLGRLCFTNASALRRHLPKWHAALQEVFGGEPVRNPGEAILRVFLDPNVLASALMGHGLCRDLLDRLVIGHSVLLGTPVLEELHGVLIRKFRVPADLWRQLETRLREFEPAPAAAVPLSVVISDSADVPILASAIAAKADALVTGDKALLELRGIKGIPILSLRQIWERLAGLEEPKKKRYPGALKATPRRR